MMIGLIASVVYSVCTNCVGVGSVEVSCSVCSGRGVVLAPAKTRVNNQNQGRGVFSRQSLPCKKCTKGLIKPGQKGSGKVRKTCPTCKGQKKIKALAE